LQQNIASYGSKPFFDAISSSLTINPTKRDTYNPGELNMFLSASAVEQNIKLKRHFYLSIETTAAIEL
jgi:hypothetical protein